MHESQIVTIIILSIAFIASALLLIRILSKNSDFQEKYSGISDAESQMKKISASRSVLENNIKDLDNEFKKKKEMLLELIKEAAAYNEDIELAGFGFYKPHFNFDTPEKYKEQIIQIRTQQKEMLKAGTAVYCSEEWNYKGRNASAKPVLDRYIELSARAFNAECDAAVASLNWHNIQTMEARIRHAHKAINELNETYKVVISYHYMELKLDELKIAYELEDAKEKEKQQQAERHKKMEEEAKLREEVELAVYEEKECETMLTEAQTRVNKNDSGEPDKDVKEITELERRLKLAREKTDRAKEMTTNRNSGYVFVISNKGAFKKDTFKIGMTRRLNPYQYIEELAVQSLPFPYDVHAVIFSEDAEALLTRLHEKFAKQRLNRVNQFKDFFTVPLRLIKEEIASLKPDSMFVDIPEAKEFRKSSAMEKEAPKKVKKEKKEEKGNTANAELEEGWYDDEDGTGEEMDNENGDKITGSAAKGETDEGHQTFDEIKETDQIIGQVMGEFQQGLNQTRKAAGQGGEYI